MFFRKRKLNSKIDKLINSLEKSNLQDLSYLIGNKWNIFKTNFLAGISRGIGMGIGFTVITAILILFLKHLVTLNIPVIGKYIRDIIDVVEKTR